MEQNNNTLMNERSQIQHMMIEFDTINSTNNNTEVMLTHHYSRYIVLLFITILLVTLLFKYSVTGEGQRGGNNRNFMNEAFFLFITMSVFLGLAHVYDNIDSYILFTILVTSYIVVKLKMIHHFK